ncbi:hypothetical protein NFI96_008314, partial [Prochilodus magdalenae]
MDSASLLLYCTIGALLLADRRAALSHARHLRAKHESEYGLIVPFSTDSFGHYVSHVLSAATASGNTKRFARSVPERERQRDTQQVFFNVTVFGKELHLRLKANNRLVAPGAHLEWHEDFEEKSRARIRGDCVFTGDVTDMPDASVAISNCDGLVGSAVNPARNALLLLLSGP